jgi:hypothetical protein
VRAASLPFIPIPDHPGLRIASNGINRTETIFSDSAIPVLYVQVAVEAISKPVDQCLGYLTGIHKRKRGRPWQQVFRDSVVLEWSFVGPRPVRIEPGVPRMLNVFRVDEKSKHIEPVSARPNWPDGTLDERSFEYRFDVAVTDGKASLPVALYVRPQSLWNNPCTALASDWDAPLPNFKTWDSRNEFTLLEIAYLWESLEPAEYPLPAIVEKRFRSLARDEKSGSLRMKHPPQLDHVIREAMDRVEFGHVASPNWTATRDDLVKYAWWQDQRPMFLFPMERI